MIHFVLYCTALSPCLQLAIADIPTNLWRGLLCYSIGHNSTDADNCGLAPVYTNLYVLFNIGFNILIILLLKYGSSNILWLCLTIQVSAVRVCV